MKNIAILDDFFPHPLSAFRFEEYTAYLRFFEGAKVFADGRSHACLNIHDSVDKLLSNFEYSMPAMKGRVVNLYAGDSNRYDLGYCIFLSNALHYLEGFERNSIPFLFTLYPGGGFLLNDPDSDAALRRVIGSKMFRRVVVTQKNIKDYLLENGFCRADQVEFLYGCTIPQAQLGLKCEGKKWYGFDKEVMDVCFVSAKYMKEGRDKGYDRFVLAARQLLKRFCNIRFHVVGGFDRHDIDVSDFGESIFFYGYRETEWFEGFYLDKDIIVSPNVPFVLKPGAFDGFPTASCVAAGLHKVAVLCTDFLGMNDGFYLDGDEIVITNGTVVDVVEKISFFMNDFEGLRSISERGWRRFNQLFSFEQQIMPRVRLLDRELVQLESDSRLNGVFAELNLLKKMVSFNGQFFSEHGRGFLEGRVKSDKGRLINIEHVGKSDGDPLISIIVPTYERCDYVWQRVIKSVLAQTYKNWELIIVGDGMRDDLANRLSWVGLIDSRIKFYNLKRRGRYPVERGPMWYVAGVKPINFGLRLAKGDWIAHLDDDDEYLPNHLEDLLRYAQRSNVEWVHAKVKFVSNSGKLICLVGDGSPRLGGISRIGSLYSASLKSFRYNISCWKYGVPADWDLWSRFLSMGVSHSHLDVVSAIHYGEPFRDDVVSSGGVSSPVLECVVNYSDWLLSRNELRNKCGIAEAGLLFDGPEIVFVINAVNSSQADLASTIGSFACQSYERIRLIVVSERENPSAGDGRLVWVEGDLISNDLLFCLAEGAPYSWLCCINAGDRISENGLAEFASHVSNFPGVSLVYSDEDRCLSDGQVVPLFKPDFDLDYLRSFFYIGRFVFIRLMQFEYLSGFAGYSGAAKIYDLILRHCECFGESAISHIPDILFRSLQENFDNEAQVQYSNVLSAHLRRCQVNAEVDFGIFPGGFHVRYLHNDQPLVSIIIPTKNQFQILQRCLEGLLERTAYRNYEIILVDNQSTDADAVHYLQGLVDLNMPNLRVLSYPHPFNFADMNNLAVQEARGEYLVLLNNDTAIVKSDWLDALLNHAQRPEVGIVGAKLLYPDGRIQHAGVILGLRGPADHPFIGEAMDAPGYCGRLLVDQQYSAVTAACMMVRKSVYEAVGGMDAESFKVSYNDVDLCLKVREAGYRVVWTPYAVVMHEANVSQNRVDKATMEAKRKRFESERLAMYRKWMPVLKGDPAYNPNLSLSGSGFTLETDLLLNPCAGISRPRVLAHHADSYGSGSYRVIQPLQAMRAAGLLEGECRENFIDPVPLARAGLDVILLQRQTTDAQLRCINNYSEFSGAKLIYELDDYLPNLPVSSAHKANYPQDILRRLRQMAAFCDRVTVSTLALKDALRNLHSDVVVLPNYLPVNWWGGISRQPVLNEKRKPRVGWAGGAGHAGDLRQIADVVKSLSGRVDWVFFGMLPKGLEAYVAEYHPGVPIENYPRQLAALDLDLALAPLEDNLFNECKSNLRLLEYGICGYPVIATDIEPYRCGLPVTLVKNRYRDWVAAIEEKLADRQGLRVEGLALQAAVQASWMLDGDNLLRWRSGWMLDEKK